MALKPARRLGSYSAKWDLLAMPYGSDAISLSVADIEFETAPVIVNAVAEAASRANYGYTEVFNDFYRVAKTWQSSRHDWQVEGEAVFFPRIIEAVCSILDWKAAERSRPLKVVTLAPYYSPILEVTRRWNCEIETLGINFDTCPASIDFSALEKLLVGADLLLWCNPHNPSGRVWRTEELDAVAELCLKNGVFVISDDIHADFTSTGHKYTPIAKVSPRLWEEGLLVQCASPGKTFAMAGLEAAVLFAPPRVAKHLEEQKRKLGLHNPNYFAIPAAVAAWGKGHDWADELVEQVNSNLALARAELLKELPNLRIDLSEGTFLLWVDARAYIADPSDFARIQELSRVLITPGEDFGSGYENFFRVNVALPAPVLLEAIERLCHAFRHIEPQTAIER